jgi:hypothetical protein
MRTRHVVWSCVVIGWLWVAAPADAHRLDEYLQATRIGVSQDRIDLEIDLTAGASIAEQIFAMVDANRDGQITDAEGDEYARRVIDAIRLSVDSRPLSVTLVSRTFPDRHAMGRGLGTIRLRATAPASAAPAGTRSSTSTRTSRRRVCISSTLCCRRTSGFRFLHNSATWSSGA